MGRKRVLVVEDEKIIQRFIKRILDQLQYDHLVAESVEKALEAVETDPIDLLVSDLKLPDGSGIEVIRRFKQKYNQKEVLIITGSLTPEDQLRQAAEFGVTNYLLKPFGVEEFKNHIEECMTSHEG